MSCPFQHIAAKLVLRHSNPQQNRNPPKKWPLPQSPPPSSLEDLRCFLSLLVKSGLCTQGNSDMEDIRDDILVVWAGPKLHP